MSTASQYPTQHHLFIQLAYTPKPIVHRLVRSLILSLDSSQNANPFKTKEAKSDLIYLHKKFPSRVIRGLNRAIQDREKYYFSFPNRLEAIFLLIRFGEERPELIKELLDFINDKQTAQHYGLIAIEALGFMKEPTLPVIETLVGRLMMPHESVPKKALVRLSKTSPKRVIQVLTKTLAEAENLRRQLKDLYKPINDMLSDLSDKISELTFICSMLQEMLVQLGQNSPKLTDPLMERLKNFTYEKSYGVAEALKQLQDPSPQQIQSLIQLLDPGVLPGSLDRSAVSEVYKLVIDILDTLGMKYPKVIDGVTKLLSSDEPDLRSKGAVILGRLQKMTPQIEAILIETISHPVPHIRQIATGILIYVENPSKELIGALISALNHTDTNICFDIALRLAEIENASQDVAKAFTQLLTHADVDLRLVAIQALRKTQQPTPQMVNMLVNIALSDDEAEACNEALETLIVFNKKYPKLIDEQIQPTINAVQKTGRPWSNEDCKRFYREMETLIHLDKATPELIEKLLNSLRYVNPNASASYDVITRLLIPLNQKTFFSTKAKSILVEILTHNLTNPRGTTIYLSAAGLIILGCTSQKVLQALHAGMENRYLWTKQGAAFVEEDAYSFVATLKKSLHIIEIETLTPYLINALKHKKNSVRFVAGRDLISFGKRPPELIKTLIAFVREFSSRESTMETERVLKWAVEELIHLGKCLPEHLKILLCTLENGDCEDFPGVIQTLKKLLSPAALCNTLNDIVHSNKNTYDSPINALFGKVETNKKRSRENDQKNAGPETKRHKTEQTLFTATVTNAAQTNTTSQDEKKIRSNDENTVTRQVGL